MPKGKEWTKETLAGYNEDYSAIVVPVNVTIEARQRILDTSRVERYLRKAKRIAVSNCECRTRVRGCDAPLEVCLYLDEAAEERIEEGLGREISLTEALANLRRTNEAGLIHVAVSNTGEKSPIYICSCCQCCCYSIAAMRRFGFNGSLISSDMIASLDEDLCDDCGACADRCPFGARMMVRGKMRYQRGKCFGCGLCVSSCDKSAITLKKRPS